MFLFPNLNTCEQRSRSPAGEEIVRGFEFARRRRGSGWGLGGGREGRGAEGAGAEGMSGPLRDWANVGGDVIVTDEISHYDYIKIWVNALSVCGIVCGLVYRSSSWFSL